MFQQIKSCRQIVFMISKKIFLLLFFSSVITLSITETPQAQSIMGFSVEDLSTLNPADISDNQLRMFIARANRKGSLLRKLFRWHRCADSLLPLQRSSEI